MKNTIARGGIEFLAVLLGLSGSLSIDSIVKEKDQKEQNTKILKRLYDNLVADSSDGSWNMKAYERGIQGSANVIKWCDSNPTFESISNDFEKDLSAMMIATIFVHNEEEYMALKNSGRTDLISNEDLIIELHRYYTEIGFIKTLDHYQNNFVQNQILPYIADYANEVLYDKDKPNNKVYMNFPKVSLYRMPDINKIRFFASNMLTWQKYAKRQYESQVKKVTAIRELLRKELEL
ncbi:MAG: hypothetical protein CMG58_04455 [Candidatus Marinimicrobia bacterium]|nr:hypothetical protein [Candidatus Neomarinimicrobiota bacterium]